MLTSFFGKSKPLHLLLAAIYIFVISGAHYFFDPETVLNLQGMALFLTVIALLVFSNLLLDFTVRKNALTLLNSYPVLIFSCLVVMISGLYNEPIVVIATLFQLLAYRRMFSLHTSKNNERKILDASLWIALASVFYFWSFLLYVPLYVAITMIVRKSVRYYLIPIVGVIAIFLIATAYHFVKAGSFAWFVNWLGDVSFDFSGYARLRTLIFITFITVMLIWTTISKFVSFTSGPRKDRPNHILGLYIMLATAVMVLISSEKTGAEFLFLFAPAAIIISGYIEKKKEIWFKEFLLWIFVLLPLLFIFI